MIVVLQRGSTGAHVRDVVAELEALGLSSRVIQNAEKPLIHVTAGPTRRARRLLRHERVQALVPTSGPRVRREGRRFYPYHFLYWCAVGLALLGGLMFLAGYRAPGIGAAVDRRIPPVELPAPWYLRPVEVFLESFPDGLAWLARPALVLVFAVVFFLPLLDRGTGARRVAAIFAGAVFLVAIGVLVAGVLA